MRQPMRPLQGIFRHGSKGAPGEGEQGCMKVLVTGGAGFIGSHVAGQFAREHEVRVLDDLRTGCEANLAGLPVDLRKDSVTDRAAVRRAVRGVDLVVHLAAQVSVVESVRDPSTCMAVNVGGLLNVLEEAAAARVKRLVFAGSSAVYGEAPGRPSEEGDPPAPESPYALSKLDGEFFCRMFRGQGRLETVSLRFFNVYGPRQDPSSPYAAAVPALALRALRGEPLVIHGDGEQTRDFVFVGDVVAAIALAARHRDASGEYNVASGRAVTVNGLADAILRVTGSSSPVRHGPPRAGEIRHSAASTARMASLGFRPACALEDGLERTLAYLRGLAAS